MTLNLGTRRGFLTGGLALLAMPALVKAEGLMKVAPTSVILPEYKFDTRVLVDYQIASDSLVMRIDRKLGRMPRPPRVMEVSIEEARRVFGNHPIFDLQPEAGRQVCAMTTVRHRAYENGVGYAHYSVPFHRPEEQIVSNAGRYDD
jgi:hypothetical protein